MPASDKAPYPSAAYERQRPDLGDGPPETKGVDADLMAQVGGVCRDNWELERNNATLRARVAELEAINGNLSRANEALLLRVGDLEDVVRLILPLAKGYAAANRVGSNQQKIETAEAALADVPPAPASEERERLPAARYSANPTYSADGYGYGGGAVLVIEGLAVPFGEGQFAHDAARKLADLWNRAEIGGGR